MCQTQTEHFPASIIKVKKKKTVESRLTPATRSHCMCLAEEAGQYLQLGQYFERLNPGTPEPVQLDLNSGSATFLAL